MNISKFWSKVVNITKSDDTKMFQLLNVVIKNIMTLLHSSACVERVFSSVNLIKTKFRIHTQNLIGLLHAKQVLKDYNLKEDLLFLIISGGDPEVSISFYSRTLPRITNSSYNIEYLVHISTTRKICGNILLNKSNTNDE
ncbi:protein FAM200A-like, partial [Aphis craccivora]